MLLRRVKDCRDSSWWGCGAAKTQMHRDLDRRPWEDEVGKSIRTSKNTSGCRAVKNGKGVRSRETMSQEANVVPEAQRCMSKLWSSPISVQR